ncbi:MAG: A/G-specific adenine glycosylase [Desulfobacterota bacterium]|nr:A/G-specific adenine glycosylase [Thermodesulfobacteriota bacterium]
MLQPGLKKKIQSGLLQWFEKNQRELPWRKTKDPYAIWVSEIMLQQTQVATVIPYYRKFLKTFPTVRSLARADLSKVLKVWEGLGYYSRARNLHRASQVIVSRFNGKIPDNIRDLLSLPGVGKSTAGAVLSIAFNQEVPILDGNVKRVLSRFFALSGATHKTEKILWKYSASLIPKGHAASFNQALMDLGATTCIPKNPFCLQCPINFLCKGYRLGEPERFPTRPVKKKIPHIEAVAAVIQKDDKLLLKQRPSKGFLGGLWEFPNWRLDGQRDLTVYLREKVKKELGLKVKCKVFLGTFQQTYSHFKLTLHVFRCQTLNPIAKGEWVAIKKLKLLPMPKIARRICENLLH